MTNARVSLTCPPQSLAKAQALADRIDEHFAIDALAVTVNETDEAKALLAWAWHALQGFHHPTKHSQD